ncbi:MAG TPA: hypothetical protein DCO65_01115 [Spartobacteria bacterium]|nr:hypothetical protein [Spartobacteria bacterium]
MTALTPHLPFAGVLGFQPMPAHFYPIIALIVVAYIVAAELAKLLFLSHTPAVTLRENIRLRHQ